jgi:hypothetical protein
MCRYLHHNELGCISRCRTGCCLHLYFGNVALRLKRHELPAWRTEVAALYERHTPPAPDPLARCLVLPGLVTQQAFVFTLEEVLLLHDLLISATLLLEAEDLLSSAAR